MKLYTYRPGGLRSIQKEYAVMDSLVRCLFNLLSAPGNLQIEDLPPSFVLMLALLQDRDSL